MMIDARQKQQTFLQEDLNSSSGGFENRRQFVRVFYPTSCLEKFLPELIVDHRSCKVMDISEGGIRFVLPNAHQMKDKTITALLRFPDGASFEITGSVVRRNYTQVALKLEKGIPYCRIMSEMLRLRNLEVNEMIVLPFHGKL